MSSFCYDKKYCCCFFGHRKITETKELRNKLNNRIEALIKDCKVHTFLFGSKSQFDDLCFDIVSKLKEKYPHIQRIYVRSAFADIDKDYTNYLLQRYEDTYYPENIRNSGKASYVERNQEMINKSSFCIVYYNENYLPSIRKNSRKDVGFYQPKSGTKIAYDYALKKDLTVYNVF